MKNPNDVDFAFRFRSLDQLAPLTLEWLRKQTTEYLVASLKSGVSDEGMEWDDQGRISEGNHRIQVLRERGYDINALARDVWAAIRGGDSQ